MYNVVCNGEIHEINAGSVFFEEVHNIWRFVKDGVCVAEFSKDKIEGWYKS